MNAIFVVGTGRSGTHFLARLLAGFENVHDPFHGEESGAILQDVAKAALHHRLPSEATEQHFRTAIRTNGPILVDQHHPNLFFASHWASRLDDPLFLYPDRPARQTVASMMRHRGVRSWYRYARKKAFSLKDRLPYPNRFLGVDSYFELERSPLHLLCVKRIAAHHRAYKAEKEKLGSRLRRVAYETLVADPETALEQIFSKDERARLGHFTLTEEPKAASLEKYRDILTEAQVREIDEIENRLIRNPNRNYAPAHVRS